MGNEFDKVKFYFLFAIVVPIVLIYFLKLTIVSIALCVVFEIIWYYIYQERLAHFKYIIEKDRKEKSEPNYIISTKKIKQLPKNVNIYEYKFQDYTIHDIYDKNSEKKQTIYRTDRKFCYVYYIEKNQLLEVKRKIAYENVLMQSFKRHENRGSYDEW